MRPLDLDDLAVLQAELEVLDERDLIAELAPDTVVRSLPSTRSVTPVAVEEADGPATQPPVRALPAVPPPADRPAPRRGPLPAVEPTRPTAGAPVAVDTARLVPVPAAPVVVATLPARSGEVVLPPRPVTGRPPVPGMTVVRVLPAVTAVPAAPTTSGRRARHAATGTSAPAHGLLAWVADEGTR